MPLIITELAIQADGTWAVEIYNQGPGDEDLSDYRIRSINENTFNGAVDISGILAAGETIVIGHSSILETDLQPADTAFDGPITNVQLITDDFPVADTIDNIGESGVGAPLLGVDVVYEGLPDREPDMNSSTTNIADFTETDGFGNNTLGAPCFAAGTFIATPDGERRVEDLTVGDLVSTEDGRAVPVLWVGRRVLRSRIGRSADLDALVRIDAGALADGMPHSDLKVTGDHGMVLDGLLVNAAALINNRTIDWVPAERAAPVTVYHVETEAHDVILANGAATETFIDYAGRQSFDNHDEYISLCGVERIFPEMTRPRITSARMLPEGLRARLAGGMPAAVKLTA